MSSTSTSATSTSGGHTEASSSDHQIAAAQSIPHRRPRLTRLKSGRASSCGTALAADPLSLPRLAFARRTSPDRRRHPARRRLHPVAGAVALSPHLDRGRPSTSHTFHAVVAGPSVSLADLDFHSIPL